MKKHRSPSFHLGLAILILVALQMTTGCASFQGKQLANVLPSQYQQLNNKPSLYVDANFYSFLTGKHTEPVENFEAKPLLSSYVEKSIDESQMFSKVSTNSADALDMDLTIQIDLTNHGSYTSAIIAGIITGITFGTIPTWVKDKYRLEAFIYDEQGNQLQKYEYEDYVKTYFHLVLIPFIGSVKTAPDKVITNMLRNFLQDLSQERFMQQYSQRGRMPEAREVDMRQKRQPAQQQRLPSTTEKLNIRVIVPDAVVRLHPEPDSAVMAQIPMGANLEVIEKKGEWYYVTFSKDVNTVTGYIHQDSVEEIKQ